MTEPILNAALFCQVGLVVHDIEASVRRWCTVLGCATPEIVETSGYAISEVTLRGERCDAMAKLAFLDAGQVQIELIQPDDQPSVWREHLDSKGEGVHHIAFKVKDTGATVARLSGEGMPVAQQGLYSSRDGMYTYLDSTSQLGVMIELLENFAGPKPRE